MGRYADFWQVTSDALGYALDANGIDDPALHEELINAYLSLKCYPEVREVLTTLRRVGCFADSCVVRSVRVGMKREEIIVVAAVGAVDTGKSLVKVTAVEKAGEDLLFHGAGEETGKYLPIIRS